MFKADGAEGPVVRIDESRWFCEESRIERIHCFWSKLPPSFQRCVARDKAARITAYEKKVETMIVLQSMQEGTKLAMRDALVPELAELEKRLMRWMPCYTGVHVIAATIGCNTLPGRPPRWSLWARYQAVACTD